jgi:hypothetical protein
MSPAEFYQKTIDENSSELKRLKGLSLLLSMLRLGVFLAVVIIIYYGRNNSSIIAITAIVGMAIFLFLIARYTDIKNKRNYFIKLVQLNKLELDVLKGDFSKLDRGEEFVFEEHHFNQDIDLFGAGSIFQSINRTGTVAGKEQLAKWLNSNDINDIKTKQVAIQELSDIPEWRQHYQVTASLIEDEVDTSRILNWIKNYNTVLPKLFGFLPNVFSLISLAGFVLYGFGYITGAHLLLWFLCGVGMTFIYFSKVSKLYNDATKMKATFQQYAKLLEAIEGQDFKSELLQSQKEKIKTEGVNASDILKQLSKELQSLDQRNNVFFAIIANGFFIWDIRYAYRIEKWIKDFESAIDKWFEVIAFVDAKNAMANYSFNHPNYIFPQISEDQKEMLTALNLGHPLLNAEKMVTNNIKMKDEDFFIITGANMAGKSTFLRTVALNLVMANCGLPVCAASFSFKPIKLISSMRTSDSLQNDESYFFSELKRLKFIVDEMKNEKFFIILDEILKGTNSKDKAEGSKKFVEKLVASNSTGLIATHDLSLCSLSDKLPQVENHYFDADIVNDELFFDYTFKDGICQNMNASFLLRKMEIV